VQKDGRGAATGATLIADVAPAAQTAHAGHVARAVHVAPAVHIAPAAHIAHAVLTGTNVALTT
jgi:hypothetical protein